MHRYLIRSTVGLGLSLGVLIAGVAGAGAAPLAATSATVVAASSTSATAGAFATSPTIATDPVAVKWLRALEQRHRDHRRASGEFRQTKSDPVFLEEIRAMGRFYYERPNKFRCDYDKPEASTNWVIGYVVTLYFPEFKQVERYRMSREGSGIGDVNQMLLAFGIETDRVLKHFTVTSDPATSANVVRLIFVPKAPRQERPFARFVLELSKPDLTPRRFVITGDEPDQTTVVEIMEIKWNDPSMPADIFQLKVPRDVDIIEEE